MAEACSRIPGASGMLNGESQCTTGGDTVIKRSLPERELTEYSVTVLQSWIRSGSIFGRVEAATRFRIWGSPELVSEPDAAIELAGLTVSAALGKFRRQLISGTGWDEGGGASMQTYFIGQCLMQFPNEYRKWIKECRAGAVPKPAFLDDWTLLTDSAPVPEAVSGQRTMIREYLSFAPPRTKQALVYIAAGYSQKEVAALMGTTAKAIEMLIWRFRKQLKWGAAGLF